MLIAQVLQRRSLVSRNQLSEAAKTAFVDLVVEFRKRDASALVKGEELTVGCEHFSHPALFGEFLTHRKCAQKVARAHREGGAASDTLQ